MKESQSKGKKSLPPVVRPLEVSKTLHRLLRSLGMIGPQSKGIKPYGGSLPCFTKGFAEHYLFGEIFSKFDDGKSSEDKELAAMVKFAEAEEQCRQTNARIRALVAQRDFFGPSDWRSFLYSTARKIQQALGPFCWNEAAMHFGFGPGSTTRLPRIRSSKVYKLSGRPHTTIDNAALAHAAILQKSPLWNKGLEFREESGYCKIVPGNRITTVPKNYKTDRCIAIEPCMNMYVQKGIGGVIRSRLRKVGVDLNDQTRNQGLALLGSRFGNLATIDLSSASDTVSYEIVRTLLPPDWLSALEQCRSRVGELPSGEIVTYQKFSSMGNGYTFELESLIFWAICSTVIDHLKLKDTRLAVYGDDLIVPTAAVPLLMDYLTFCGFSTNTKKTHVDGPFRESCGKHYISGAECTPFYVKRQVDTLSDLFLLHNNLSRWRGRTQTLTDGQKCLVGEALVSLRKLAPVKWRKPRLPDGYGDGAFIGTFDECTPQKAPNGLEGFVVTALADVAEYEEFTGPGRLTASLFVGFTAFGWAAECDPNKPRELAGGVPLPPRKRAVKMLVPRFVPGN